MNWKASLKGLTMKLSSLEKSTVSVLGSNVDE